MAKSGLCSKWDRQATQGQAEKGIRGKKCEWLERGCFRGTWAEGVGLTV